jgi:hypothetical protein
MGPWKGSAPKVCRGVHIVQTLPPTCTGVFGFFVEKIARSPTEVCRGRFLRWVNRYQMGRPAQVRFTPGSDRIADIQERQLRARSGLL